MSKDIRSFFAVKSSALTQKKLSFKGENAKSHQKKRTALVIDSDSDDDVSFGSVKRSKVSSAVVDKNNGPVVKNDRSPRKKTSKYFQAESVNASDMFGERPVKRDSARNIIKKTVKKESLEFHTDKELESELMNLDFNEDSLLTNGGIDCKIDSHDPSNCEATKKRLVNRDKETSLDCDEPGKKVPKIERNISPRKSPWKKTTEESKVIHKDPFDCDESPKKKAKLDNHLSPHLSPSKKPEIKTKSDSLKVETLSVKSSKKLDSESKQSTTRSNSLEVSPSKGKSTMKSPSKLHLSENLSSPISKTSPTEKKNKNADSNLSTGSFYKKISLFVEKEEKRTDTLLSHKTTKEKASSDKLKSKNIAEDNKAVTESKTLNDLDSSLWVEKYKPTTTKQIIGQQGDKSCVNKLTMWLKNWYQNQSGSKKLAKPSPWAKNDDGAYFKAALLSGPPGVGKTTTAHLVSKELGFDVVEFNASDTRSKKLLHQEVSELLSTSSLNPYFTGKGEQVTKQHVLLMDEVDGMAGNEDRGGVQELIQLIKQSRVPIICMCNDRNHPKIRSLANYCFDLRFSKPRVEQIRGAMLSMCFKEKLKLTPNVLSDVITSANQDIRLIINHLSMLSMESSKLENSTKHIKMGPWDITRKVFSEEEHKTMTIYDKCDLFFHDYSVTPLFVQENYLNAVPHKPEAKNKIKKMELFAAAAKSLSFGDLAEKSIRSHNAWGLLPVQAIFSSLVPGDVLEGHIGAQINFPAWFGKNSRQTKMSRLLQELTVHSRLKISGNKEAMNLDYLTPLESSIVSPLVREGTDGIPEALAVLSEYCLVREDMESLAELSSWPNTKNRFSEVESKVKAAFTRAYNKTSAPTPYAPAPVKKANRADTDFSASTPEEEEETSQGLEEEEEDDDDLEVDGMIVMKKKQVAKKADKEEKPSTSKNSKPSKRGRKK